MNILLIEDDEVTATFVCDGLRTRGHVVETVRNGGDGLHSASTGGHDVAVIDRMLPRIEGLAIVRALRAVGSPLPVILLTALGAISDRVEGLRGGADDYLVKPFDLDELDARLWALVRRPARPEPTLARCGELAVDRLRRRATLRGGELDLTASEFAILDILVTQPERIVTRAMLLEQVFDLDRADPGTVIEPHVSRLRAKLARAGDSPVILTVRGRGYTLHEP